MQAAAPTALDAQCSSEPVAAAETRGGDETTASTALVAADDNMPIPGSGGWCSSDTCSSGGSADKSSGTQQLRSGGMSVREAAVAVLRCADEPRGSSAQLHKSPHLLQDTQLPQPGQNFQDQSSPEVAEAIVAQHAMHHPVQASKQGGGGVASSQPASPSRRSVVAAINPLPIPAWTEPATTGESAAQPKEAPAPAKAGLESAVGHEVRDYRYPELLFRLQAFLPALGRCGGANFEDTWDIIRVSLAASAALTAHAQPGYTEALTAFLLLHSLKQQTCGRTWTCISLMGFERSRAMLHPLLSCMQMELGGLVAAARLATVQASRLEALDAEVLQLQHVLSTFSRSVVSLPHKLTEAKAAVDAANAADAARAAALNTGTTWCSSGASSPRMAPGMIMTTGDAAPSFERYEHLSQLAPITMPLARPLPVQFLTEVAAADVAAPVPVPCQEDGPQWPEHFTGACSAPRRKTSLQRTLAQSLPALPETFKAAASREADLPTAFSYSVVRSSLKGQLRGGRGGPSPGGSRPDSPQHAQLSARSPVPCSASLTAGTHAAQNRLHPGTQYRCAPQPARGAGATSKCAGRTSISPPPRPHSACASSWAYPSWHVRSGGVLAPRSLSPHRSAKVLPGSVTTTTGTVLDTLPSPYPRARSSSPTPGMHYMLRRSGSTSPTKQLRSTAAAGNAGRASTGTHPALGSAWLPRSHLPFLRCSSASGFSTSLSSARAHVGYGALGHTLGEDSCFRAAARVRTLSACVQREQGVCLQQGSRECVCSRGASVHTCFLGTVYSRICMHFTISAAALANNAGIPAAARGQHLCC
jgi:hypothetical protein